MKLVIVFLVVTFIVIINSQGFMIPKELESEAKAIQADMEKVGVKFIGDMPDPSTMNKMTPELKTRAEEFKHKLIAAGAILPPMPGA